MQLDKLIELLGDDLRGVFLEIWQDMIHGNYEALWLHKWRQHGMYSGLDVREYFQRVCDLYGRIPDLDGIFDFLGKKLVFNFCNMLHFISFAVLQPFGHLQMLDLL